MKPQLDKIRAEAAFGFEKLPKPYDMGGDDTDESAVFALGAQAENARLNAIIDKLIRVIERQDEALEFYGDMNNWLEIEGTDGCREQISADSFQHSNGFSVGGKRARTAQAEVRAILSGQGEK